MEITKDMQISDVAKKKPEAAEVMLKYGLHCIGCPVSMMETVEQGAKAHGMTDEEIGKMLDEINSKEKKKGKKAK